MSKQDFYSVLKQEVARIDEAKTSKRHEKLLKGSPQRQPSQTRPRRR